jgi:uncharacterized protein (TIGR02147 family)
VKKATKLHYREFLERELRVRIRRNPRYSLRAFARDIGMQPSKLSEVLSGIRGLSKATAEKVVQKIGLSSKETAVFLNLVDAHQKRNRIAQRLAEEKLKALAADTEYGALSLERFKIIADWHHFAILELTELSVFKSDPKWIANRLGLSTAAVVEAINRLIEFDLLKKDENGELKQTRLNLATASPIASRAIREHHSQILSKAENSLHESEVDEHDFSSTTLAFSSEQMDEIRNELKKLRRRLGDKIQKEPHKDRVYCLSMQLFPLDKKEAPRP